MALPILNTFTRRFVYEKFDATNPSHLTAYICLKNHGRQHPTLRFYLEDPFLSVPHMMESRVADLFLTQHADLVASADDIVRTNKGDLVTLPQIKSRARVGLTA
jgi:hypothetical protein